LLRHCIPHPTSHRAAIGLTLALAAVAFLALGSARPAQAQGSSLEDTTGTVPGPPIRSVAAQGFVNVDSLVVVRTFGITPGQAYDPRETRSGVRRLFATGLFTDVTVSDAPAPDGGVALTIHVTERPRIKEI